MSDVNNMFNDYPDLLTINDLQKMLRVGRTLTYRIINDGTIKHFRVGKNIKIPKQCVIDYVINSCYNIDSSKFAVERKELSQ